jgi:type III secretion system FlhB-like substrate exporter
MSQELANKLKKSLVATTTIENNTTTTKEGKTTMETKVIKKSASVKVNIFENPSLADKVSFFAHNLKNTYMEGAINNIRATLNIYWFDRLFKAEHFDYIKVQYDNIIISALAKTNEVKEVNFETLTSYGLSLAEIETIKARQEKTYTFNEIKDYISEQMLIVTNHVSATLKEFCIH